MINRPTDTATGVPKPLLEMTDEEHLALLEGIRYRRLLARRRLEEAMKLKAEKVAEKQRARLEKLITSTEKELVLIDKKLLKLENNISELQLIKLELGMPLSEVLADGSES